MKDQYFQRFSCLSSIQKLNFSYLKSTDPFINLATENEILENISENTLHLLFYRNGASVVMGRFQNPYIECDLDKMAKDNIKLVRRQSGGGCVYHDLNNLNYSIIAPRYFHSKDFNHERIIEGLKDFSINAISTKRVDLFTEDKDKVLKKFSGSAFKEKRETAFHHGTFLIDSDLNLLNEYLNPKLESVSSKSIPSIRSKVVNLKSLSSNISCDSLIEAIVEKFEKKLNLKSCKVDQFTFNEKYFNTLKSRKWIFEETPKFELDDSLKFSKGSLNIEITLKKLIIQELSIDCLEVPSPYLDLLTSTLIEKSIFDVDKLLAPILKEYEEFYEFNLAFRLWFENLSSAPRKLSIQMSLF